MTMTLPLLPAPESEPDDHGLGMLTCDRGWLPLTAVDVDAMVSGLNASVVVRQSFHNPFSQAIEATYIHPLPDRAAVTAFTVTIGDRRIEGRLKERGEARATYDEAIATGHRAAIAEEERPDLFTTRVGNLQPGERADVELTLAQPLPWEDGQATFQFPLVVAPRFIPGRPLDGEQVGEGVALDTDAVPDASRISPPVLLPGLPNPVRLGLRVRFADGPPDDASASLHTVVAGDGELALRPGERLDRDFILRWGVSDTKAGAPTAQLTLAPDPDGELDGDGSDADESDEPSGTFTFTLLPPASAATGRPRDVVVVLDRSGSMQGWKMVAARRAAARIIDTLTASDHFSLLAFDHEIERPTHLAAGLVPATDRNRWLAVEWLATLEARGGTQLAGPLVDAVGLLAGGGERQASCLVVTDGQVGNEDQVLSQVGQGIGRTRIFTVGIDRSVNAGFLRRLAALGGGRCELVESEDRLDEVMTAVHRRIASPALESVELRATAGSISELSPSRPVDCFTGVPLVVRGRYRGAAPELRWTAAGRRKRPGGSVSGAEVADPAARPLWARARIRDLEDAYAAAAHDHDHDPEQQAAEIVSLSLATGVLSRFTAFVAVDLSERVDSTSPQPVVQPVEAPSGWAAGSPPGAAMAPPMPAPMLASQPLAAMKPGASRGGPAAPPPPSSAMPPPAPFAAPVPPASPLPVSGAAGGLRRTTMRRKRQGDAPPVDRVVGTDLSRYLDRLDELLASIDAGGTGADVERDLRDLADDLRSVDAPKDLVGAIEHLLAKLDEAGAAAPEAVAALRDAMRAVRDGGARAGRSSTAGDPDRRRSKRFWR